MLVDDELSNSETKFAQDAFAERFKFSIEEDLPWFGSLVADQNQLSRRKSQNVSGKSVFSDAHLSTNSSVSKNVSQAKSTSDRASALHTSQKNKTSYNKTNIDFSASGGKQYSNLFQNSKSKIEKSKEKKPSMWEDDELLFAVAQNDQK